MKFSFVGLSVHIFNFSALDNSFISLKSSIKIQETEKTMSKKLIKNLFLLVMVFVFAFSVRAWDDAGHKLTGYIAWQTMSADVREKVTKILLSAPEDSDLSVFYLSSSRSDEARKRELFMIATTWADIVRDRDFKVRYEKYHKSNWHYADTFWTLENNQVKILPNPNDEGGKAVEKLFDFEKVLKDANASNADKAIALAWILHLGGDIHQPLHTSARVTELEPKGDQGGNLFLLTPKDTPRQDQVNLHWFWDSIVGRNTARKNDACDADYLPPIAAEMMKKYPLAKMQNRLNLGKFDVWQQESFKIASTEVFPSTLIRFQTPTENYKKNAFKIAQQQIALAGYRLGAMLNQIFGANQTTAQNPPCKIIRQVKYPVTQTNPSNSKLEICLLNLCPADKGMMARPMMGMMLNGKIEMFEYDVEKVFKTEKEAREYAAQNGITDISVN